MGYVVAVRDIPDEYQGYYYYSCIAQPYPQIPDGPESEDKVGQCQVVPRVSETPVHPSSLPDLGPLDYPRYNPPMP